MQTNPALERIDKAAQAIRAACGEADVAVILGSGLGDYAKEIENPKVIHYRDVPGFPVSTVPGHAGCWCAGTLHGKRVAMMRGRFHYYEGYSLQDVTLPVRVMLRLGVKTLVVTNAAGGVNLDFAPGDLMLIHDVINMLGVNALFGENLDDFGPRFPDMSKVFDPQLMQIARESAKARGQVLREGVYAQMSGPSFETPAEIRMLRLLGADAVGMSTVPEVTVARHGGMRILGVSCITNMAAGILDQPLNHEEVMETGARASRNFRALLDDVIAKM